MINIEETRYACDKESMVHVIDDESGHDIIREQMIILAKWNSNHSCYDSDYGTNTIEQIRQNAETILNLASIIGAVEELQKL